MIFIAKFLFLFFLFIFPMKVFPEQKFGLVLALDRMLEYLEFYKKICPSCELIFYELDFHNLKIDTYFDILDKVQKDISENKGIILKKDLKRIIKGEESNIYLIYRDNSNNQVKLFSTIWGGKCYLDWVELFYRDNEIVKIDFWRNQCFHNSNFEELEIEFKNYSLERIRLENKIRYVLSNITDVSEGRSETYCDRIEGIRPYICSTISKFYLDFYNDKVNLLKYYNNKLIYSIEFHDDFAVTPIITDKEHCVDNKLQDFILFPHLKQFSNLYGLKCNVE